MLRDFHITVVIPAHNEGKLVAAVLAAIPAFVDRIIVVDDASTDDTSRVVGEWDDERLTLLRTPRNLGVGGAMITGFRHALERPTDIVVKVDGDAQMPLDRLASLLGGIIDHGADYAKGNRFLAGSSLREMPKVRLFGNVVLTFMTKLASGYWHVFDPQNGFLAIRAAALGTLDLDRIALGYFFENDMLVQLNILSYRVVDVPMPSIYGDEESGLSVAKTCFLFPLLLLRRFCYRILQKYVLRDFSPIVLFLLLGALLFGAGVVFGAYTWIRSAMTGLPATTGTVMLSVLPTVLGFQLLLQAIVLDIQESRTTTPHVPFAERGSTAQVGVRDVASRIPDG